jgi:hypothetical protein
LDNKFISNNVVVSIYLVLLEVAACRLLPGELNEPLIDAVAESLEKSIRFTIDDIVPGVPPPNQP